VREDEESELSQRNFLKIGYNPTPLWLIHQTKLSIIKLHFKYYLLPTIHCLGSATWHFRLLNKNYLCLGPTRCRLLLLWIWHFGGLLTFWSLIWLDQGARNRRLRLILSRFHHARLHVQNCHRIRRLCLQLAVLSNLLLSFCYLRLPSKADGILIFC